MTDTWGIPGPTFLWLFIAAAVIAVAATVLHRRRLFQGPAGYGGDDLPPSHVAFLAEGPQRAIHASLARLRKAGAIDADEETGRFSRLGGVPEGATALDSAVLHAAGQNLRAGQIRNERSVQAALEGIQADLERRGLLLSRQARQSARKGAWLLLALVALGVLRLIAGAQGGRPIGYLVMVLIVLTPITLFFLFNQPRLTRAGRQALVELRRKYQHLDRAYQPAWGTYDPVMTGLAVGLFGAALLWEADPHLATVAAIGRPIYGTEAAGLPGYVPGGGFGDGGGGSGGAGDGGGGGGCGG